jgi:hypothetical protein
MRGAAAERLRAVVREDIDNVCCADSAGQGWEVDQVASHEGQVSAVPRTTVKTT